MAWAGSSKNSLEEAYSSSEDEHSEVGFSRHRSFPDVNFRLGPAETDCDGKVYSSHEDGNLQGSQLAGSLTGQSFPHAHHSSHGQADVAYPRMVLPERSVHHQPVYEFHSPGSRYLDVGTSDAHGFLERSVTSEPSPSTSRKGSFGEFFKKDEASSSVDTQEQHFSGLPSNSNISSTRAISADHCYASATVEPCGTGSTSSNTESGVTAIVDEESSKLQSAAQGPQNQIQLHNWQANMTSLKERFAFLFNSEILSDVHFKVGRGENIQRIPAHKFVLSVGSAVFDAMFNGKLSTQEEEIELPDIEPQAFLSLLKYLYSDEVQIGPESVMTVLYTAKKYAVPSLEKHCVEFLKRNLSSDNAFMLLTQALLFDETQLAALCLDTIDKSTNDALKADGFADIDHDTLCLVLERSTLQIREIKLFQAVVRWAEAKCGDQGIPVTGDSKRTVLGRALSLIRFPLMSIEEFAHGPAQSHILTDQEVVQIFLYFTVNPKPSLDYSAVPRCNMVGRELKVNRFQQIESRWGYSGTSDRIRFFVDKRIFVVGFGLYGSIMGASEYEVNIQIILTSTGKVCASNDVSFTSDCSQRTFKALFKEPVEILPNTNYTAYATLKGPDSYYGTKGVRNITIDCPNGENVTFQFTYAAGNNNGTSVEDGQIPEIIFYT